jgi:hypothetical protein
VIRRPYLALAHQPVRRAIMPSRCLDVATVAHLLLERTAVAGRRGESTMAHAALPSRQREAADSAAQVCARPQVTRGLTRPPGCWIALLRRQEFLLLVRP